MTPIPTITTQRLTMRAPSLADFTALTAFYASDRSKFVGGPATAEQTWRFLAAELGHWALRGYGRWTVVNTQTGDIVGLVGLWNPHGWPEPEIGWDVMNGFEGHGYATEAATAARDYAYDTLGWTTIVSLVAIGNDASAAVAQRLGATAVGLFEHERHGALTVYRHLSPSERAA